MDMSRVSTTTFPLISRSLDDALAIVAAAGFTKVDLLGKMPHLSLDPKELPPEQVLAAARRHGLRVANLATYVGAAFASENPADHEREWNDVRRAVDLAAALGARSIRGFRSPQYDDAKSIPRIAPWIRRCADYAAAKNVYLGIENHGGGISGVPEMCRELCRKVGSPFFGVLYDPCNLWTRGTDYRQGFEVMKEHIVHVHLKDGTSTAKSQATTMLGAGQIDLPWILRQLDAIGYPGDVALEYEMETVPADVGLKQWYQTFRKLAGG